MACRDCAKEDWMRHKEFNDELWVVVVIVVIYFSGDVWRTIVFFSHFDDDCVVDALLEADFFV